jgi:transposase
MVFDEMEETGTRFGVIPRVARTLGIGTESVRLWVRQAEIDGGQRRGLSAKGAERIGRARA